MIFVYQKLKRGFDFTISLCVLILISPILAVTALLVRLKLGSPILFKQERSGYMGKPFEIYKFRTMTDEVDSSGHLLTDGERLTSFGLLLRKLSIDELPQLWNVLIGDMSLVGPRPLFMDYLTLYNNHQARRHEVRPGITGEAQINGRNLISWEEKFDFDVWYVENQSFFLDIKILLLTIGKLIRFGEKARSETMIIDFFLGSANHKESSNESSFMDKGNV